MTANDHRKIHEALHKSLDQLVADYLLHNSHKLPSSTSLTELMTWAYEQTIKPTSMH